MGSMIRATNLWGYDALVHDLGGDPRELRARYGIAPGVEDLEEAFVEFAAMSALFETTAAELGCTDFGLRLVDWQGLGILGPVAVMARNAATVGDGVRALARYLHAHSPALHLQARAPEPDGSVAFRYRISEPSATGHRQAYELSLANGARIIRMLSGDSGPKMVSFLHAQLGPSESYRRALGCEVHFSADWCGFVAEGATLERTIDTADPDTRRIASAYLEANYAQVGAGTADRVAELVRRLLPTGHYAADDVAEHLHLHPRSLQRRLAEEQTTYAAILDRQRRELALRYLAQPRLQVGQVAGLLGYSEQSAFNRSFRRWFDTTPRAWRTQDVGAHAGSGGGSRSGTPT